MCVCVCVCARVCVCVKCYHDIEISYVTCYESLCRDMNVCHDMKFDSCYLTKDKISPQISLTKCVYMTNTLMSNYVFQYF